MRFTGMISALLVSMTLAAGSFCSTIPKKLALLREDDESGAAFATTSRSPTSAAAEVQRNGQVKASKLLVLKPAERSRPRGESKGSNVAGKNRPGNP